MPLLVYFLAFEGHLSQKKPINKLSTLLAKSGYFIITLMISYSKGLNSKTILTLRVASPPRRCCFDRLRDFKCKIAVKKEEVNRRYSIETEIYI